MHVLLYNGIISTISQDLQDSQDFMSVLGAVVRDCCQNGTPKKVFECLPA